jgi:hypothetical protein
MGSNFFISPFTIALFFTTVTLLEGKTLQDASKKIEKDLPSTWVASLIYWPVIGFLNFRFVPVQNRVIFGSLAGIVWNIFMSNQAHRRHQLEIESTRLL